MTVLNNMINDLSQSSANIDIAGLTLCVIVSLICAVIIMGMYSILYDKKEYGSQIHKSFIIVAPSVTAMFLAIQFSLPLSLGLLGALSFVRFRTPVKDPEEVAYMLLLIAVSIACATYNFALALIIITAVFIGIVGYKRFVSKSFLSLKTGHILLSVDNKTLKENEITILLKEHFKNVKLKNLSNNGDGLLNLHYSFSAKDKQDYDELLSKINLITTPVSLNIVFEAQSI